MTFCASLGCGRPVVARGYCSKHYLRLRRAGELPVLPRLSTEERFRKHFAVDDASGCWLWTSFVNDTGYGRFSGGLAHRAAFELFVGPIPEGLTIDHLCRVRSCVNPAHMEPVPLIENIRRAEEGLGAQRRRQTECVHGHPFDKANTWVDRRGRRHCRKCCAARTRAAKQRRLARLAALGEVAATG